MQLSNRSSMINQAAQTEPIMVVGNMKINLTESEENEFHKLTKTLFQNTEALDKPTVYTCSENIHSKGEFVWNEIWISKTALDEHLASDHFQNWWAWVEPRLREPLNVIYVEMSNTKTI